MAGAQDIRRRIRGIRSMEQITKAMEMVAASKLRKAQNGLTAARPYTHQLQGVLERLSQVPMDVRHPLLQKRPVQKVVYVLITADRGLCGGYNANLVRMTSAILAEAEHEVHLIPVGRRGRDFFRRSKMEFLAEYIGIGDVPNTGQAKEIAKKVISLYEQGEADEVNLIFTEFITTLNQRPTQLKLLPLEQPEGSKTNKQYIFEPSAEEIMDTLLPKYVENQIFRVLLEGKTSEQGARMTAMSSASDNAADMIERLSLAMNRARQAAITTEISEIVSGAAALE